MDEAVRENALAALARLWEQGCPMAGPGIRERTVAIGFRRWVSFERRHKRCRLSVSDRIEDLAKGLCAALDPSPDLVGPGMQDYRCVASTLAHVFDPQLTTEASDG